MARRPAALTQQRQPLSKDRVLRAAMELADREGIEALSMRRLASELGVEAMSLYYYVKSKDDILDGIVDLALSEVEPPSSGSDWKSAVRDSAISYHDTLRRHRWVTSVPTSGDASVAQLRYMDALLGRLREAGLSPELTHHAYHALDSHVVGSALWLARVPPKDELDALARDVLRQLPVDSYPDLVLHVQQHLSGAARGMKFFEFGLDLILDGIERRRDASRSPASAPRGGRRRQQSPSA
jgi:AcrR family transcriptional regulator